MTGLSGFSYAQVRMQSRFGSRTGSTVWLRLQNIHDLASYLQVAQQTPLRHWVLGISATHSSHEIEFTLRQKFRLHVDEVANWMPDDWRASIRWLKRLIDLPVLQYLISEGAIMQWMKSDPEISNFTAEEQGSRLRAMHEAGCSSLVNAWSQGDSILSGWLRQWNEIRPQRKSYNEGLKSMEKMLYRQLKQQREQSSADAQTEYEVMDEDIRTIFRRYAFQPAAVCAYLAFIAIDIHHLRSDLLQRVFYPVNEDIIEGLQQ